MKNLKIFTENIEQEAISQIDLLLEQEPFKECKVRIMPDVHSGAGCVIGFTADLRDKIFSSLDYEEKMEEFKKTFEKNKKYKCIEFYRWHNLLTGSCELGRKTFIKNHDINIDTDTYTVQEFIKMTKNDYGGEHIKKLEKYYK